MKKAIFTLIYIFVTIGTIFAQQQAIGNWRSHLSYHNVTYTEPAGEIIYALGNNGLFSYNTDDTSNLSVRSNCSRNNLSSLCIHCGSA